LIDHIYETYEVTREALTAGTQTRQVTEARSVFCSLASKHFGMTGRELSRELQLTPVAIHYAIARGEKYLAENKQMRVAVAKYLTRI